jgi:hypothetical protein
MGPKKFTSIDELESLWESLMELDFDVDGVAISQEVALVVTCVFVVGVIELTVHVESTLELLELDRSSLCRCRTAPTRSLAMRDHDSSLLCASQQAAGPNPLIILKIFYDCTKFRFKILSFLLYSL